MNTKSRTHNTVVNILVNFLYQFILVFFTFFTRRLFIKMLGIEFLGIGGLFNNLLEILSLAELGIGGAIAYSMYKEIACNNKEKIKALTAYYKSLYNKIALIVFVIGISMLPFIKYLVNIENPIEYLEVYYLLNLANMVASYLFVYKTTIVSADQNGYKLKFIGIISEIIKYMGICLILSITHSYILYLILQIVFTIFNNIIRSYYSTRWYPFLNENYTELAKEEKNIIWKNIKDMFSYKLGGVILNHTDNILISVIVNTIMVGIYSNYMMIYNKINSFMGLIFSSLGASLGNLNASSTKDTQYNIFNIINFVSNWLFLIACIGILFVGEDVILAICGTSEYLLNKNILYVSTFGFFIQGLLYPGSTFRQTSGLFKMAKYSMFLCTILNIVLSIILGKIWGLFGIILATAISRIVTNVWYEPYILHKKFFCKSIIPFIKKQLIHFILTILNIILLFPIMKSINIDNLYIRIFVKIIICCFIPNIIMLVSYSKSEELKYFVNKISLGLKKIKTKEI